MTQKEFEERTGLKLTADNYTEVETCYMNTDLDKDAFCKLWMKNPAALKEIEQKTVLVRELYEERKCLANFLIEQAEKWSASDLREKAILDEKAIYAKGLDDGIKEGLEKGKQKEKLEIAKKLKKEGMNTELIAEITGLKICLLYTSPSPRDRG